MWRMFRLVVSIFSTNVTCVRIGPPILWLCKEIKKRKSVRKKERKRERERERENIHYFIVKVNYIISLHLYTLYKAIFNMYYFNVCERIHHKNFFLRIWNLFLGTINYYFCISSNELISIIYYVIQSLIEISRNCKRFYVNFNLTICCDLIDMCFNFIDCTDFYRSIQKWVI